MNQMNSSSNLVCEICDQSTAKKNYAIDFLTDKDGKIVLTSMNSIKHGCLDLLNNHRTIIGILRRAIENMHGGLKQNAILRHVMSRKLLAPVGKKLATSLGYEIS